MELTQEHFDQEIKSLQTSINDKIEAQAEELKTYIHESFETQQEYVDERFHQLFNEMRVNEELVQLKQDMLQVKAALHLS